MANGICVADSDSPWARTSRNTTAGADDDRARGDDRRWCPPPGANGRSQLGAADPIRAQATTVNRVTTALATRRAQPPVGSSKKESSTGMAEETSRTTVVAISAMASRTTPRKRRAWRSRRPADARAWLLDTAPSPRCRSGMARRSGNRARRPRARPRPGRGTTSPTVGIARIGSDPAPNERRRAQRVDDAVLVDLHHTLRGRTQVPSATRSCRERPRMTRARRQARSCTTQTFWSK